MYLAEDLKHHRKVAVKDSPAGARRSCVGADSFRAIIETTAGLQHPHILGLIDSGEVNGTAYYVMPFVEGESLPAGSRGKQLPLDDALRITWEVADALSYAHSKGVIHRDIKPENILLTSGHAVVADFGIARAISAAGGERLTETGLAVGTPAYMSPEQAAGDRDLDGRSDLYALACVLYEMLAGEPPFRGPTVEAVVRQHLTVEPRSVTRIPPGAAEVAEALNARWPRLRRTGSIRWAVLGSVGTRTFAPRDGGTRVVATASLSTPIIAALAILFLSAIGIWYWRHRGPTPLEVQRRTQVTLDRDSARSGALPRWKVRSYSGSKGALIVRQVEAGCQSRSCVMAAGRGRPPGRPMVNASSISPRGSNDAGAGRNSVSDGGQRQAAVGLGA